jgi:hypothetical protein
MWKGTGAPCGTTGIGSNEGQQEQEPIWDNRKGTDVGQQEFESMWGTVGTGDMECRATRTGANVGQQKRG